MDAIHAFAQFAIAQNADFTPLDQVYVVNRLYALVGEQPVAASADERPLALLDALVAAGVAAGKVADTAQQREQLAAEIMALATPLPSTVNRLFWARYAENPKAATDWFYALSKANNYIQTRAIAKNVAFTTPTEFGDLEITINLSKPEKNPRDIAAAAKQTASDYPACALCMENEGYAGRPGKAARANHRIVRLTVGGRTWGMQYSPYAYFDEHAIFLDREHRPMHIGAATFTNLLELVTLLPHYFVGSNADLPIVGGSMLAHEHYQGGRHDFPMAKAPVIEAIALPQFPDVTVGIVRWPMSVLRLTSDDPQQLAACAEHIRRTWAAYSDPEVGIAATAADGTLQHTVTPIARRVDAAYQLDLVLRDNQTSTQYPDGVFHPHPDVQHIKRENIGLIEVMGLAVLPARLVPELAEIRRFLLDQPHHMADSHRAWAEQLKAEMTWHEENATAQLNQAVGQVFARVLADAGVFKWDEAGRSALARFCATLG